jgi:hypothetical protein
MSPPYRVVLGRSLTNLDRHASHITHHVSRITFHASRLTFHSIKPYAWARVTASTRLLTYSLP